MKPFQFQMLRVQGRLASFPMRTPSWRLPRYREEVARHFQERIDRVETDLGYSSFFLNTWNATSTGSFRLPDSGSVPRHLIYLFPLLVMCAGGVLALAWRKLRGTARA